MKILKKLNTLFNGIKKELANRRCKQGKHKWKKYKRRTDKFVYYMRECTNCEYTEIQQNGVRGDGKWKDVTWPFNQKWEQEEFDRSVRDEE